MHTHTHTLIHIHTHREEEIIMPDEHSGEVKENYQWKVSTHLCTHTSHTLTHAPSCYHSFESSQ